MRMVRQSEVTYSIVDTAFPIPLLYYLCSHAHDKQSHAFYVAPGPCNSHVISAGTLSCNSLERDYLDSSAIVTPTALREDFEWWLKFE